MHRPSLIVALASSATLFAAACGSVVVAPGGTTSSGGGGGGAPTTGTTGTTTSASGGGAVCGGKAGIPCGNDEFCKFDPSSPCGNFDATGVCQPKPQGCTADCPGACGCDGQFYCNACGANAAGVDVSPNGCVTEGDTYRAVNMFTNVPRFVILKRSPSRSLCFRLITAAEQSLGVGIVGDGFSVENVEVTDDVTDCDGSPVGLPPPKGQTFSTSSMTAGAGTLSFTSAATQCTAGIHGTVSFSGPPSWVPPTEPFDADGLLIESGCP